MTSPARETPPVGWRLMTMMRVSESGCWKWGAYTNPEGYGRVSIDGRQTMAHRASYEYFVGPIQEGLEIDHRCRERSCINPYHLEAVNRRENVLRGEGTAGKNARKTECKRGHPFDESNTYLSPDGRRVCRTCRRAEGRERMRQWRAEQVAA